MIKSFKHKGLKKYFQTGSISGIQAKHQRKLRMQLAAIDTAQEIDDINLPGFKLHPLKGNRDEVWSITVNGNWHITFEFIDDNAYILNYEDYH
ncbi:Killer protein [Colwellia sp. 39_35_sub15_T18]|nr:Killer protein [Colwellia sp. 39_35_sub15_T18]